MTDFKPVKGVDREKLLDELHERYGSQTLRQPLLYLRKKYFWLIVVKTSKGLKRFVDVCASFVLILLLSPLFLLVAACIKLTDGGPVFYLSTRLGKWGREFTILKFRSMVPNAEKIKEGLHTDDPANLNFKMKNDPRVTWIGRFIRKTSIDELPQLICVLKGDMTLVGPRPPLPAEVNKYSLGERRRLDVTPGITCIWQVSGRSELTFDQQVDLDLQYIKSQSFYMDVKLLFKTIPAVLFGRGAY